MKVFHVGQCYIVLTVEHGIDIIVPYGISDDVYNAVAELKTTGLKLNAWHYVSGWDEADNLLREWISSEIQSLERELRFLDTTD